MLAIIEAIFRYVTEILNIVTGIQTAQANQATEVLAQQIFSDTEEIKLKINDSVIGLAAIQAQLATFQATTATDFTAVLTAIAALPQTGDPYPFGQIDTGNITVALLEAIAFYVWINQGPVTGNAMNDLVENIWAFVQNRAGFTEATVNLANYPWVLMDADDPRSIVGGSELLPTLDYSTILESDATAVDWINRVQGAGTVFDGGAGVPILSSADGHFFSVPSLDTAGFADAKESLGLTPAVHGPPVWPGLAGVTLGTSVPLATGVTVTGPMQGVIIALTSVPTFKGQFLYDTDISYLTIGSLTFKSDNGQDEVAQGLGFTSALYLPKSMSVAAACLIRTAPGLVGTVTPFTIP
jgi:hypothetical protein